KRRARHRRIGEGNSMERLKTNPHPGHAALSLKGEGLQQVRCRPSPFREKVPPDVWRGKRGNLFLLLVAAFTWADSPQDLYRSGNAAYSAGKFSDAAQKYQAAADQGLKNWILEFDLGNAYYRAGQIGKAILHYERAFRMNAGQGDVIYNLNL